MQAPELIKEMGTKNTLDKGSILGLYQWTSLSGTGTTADIEYVPRQNGMCRTSFAGRLVCIIDCGNLECHRYSLAHVHFYSRINDGDQSMDET